MGGGGGLLSGLKRLQELGDGQLDGLGGCGGQLSARDDRLELLGNGLKQKKQLSGGDLHLGGGILIQ
jgi:hypothetical protein